MATIITADRRGVMLLLLRLVVVLGVVCCPARLVLVLLLLLHSCAFGAGSQQLLQLEPLHGCPPPAYAASCCSCANRLPQLLCSRSLSSAMLSVEVARCCRCEEAAWCYFLMRLQSRGL